MKTLLGYHDKKKEHYGILEKNLPMLVDERYVPFLMTTDDFYLVETHKLIEKTRAFPVQRLIRSAKSTIATILIIPGIVTAALYILDFVTALLQTNVVPDIFPTWLTNITFWLAVWGAMILWHETYKTIHLPDRIGRSSSFTAHDLKIIKHGDLGLSKKTVKQVLDLLESDSEEILLRSMDEETFDSYVLFRNLLEHENAKLILERLSMNHEIENLLTRIATEKTLPSYPPSAVRSLLIYAAEEAILSRSESIEPQHLFIAYFKLFPALAHYLRTKRLNVELMRFVSTWIQMKTETVQSTKIFDPSVPYYRNGGIALSWIYGYTYVLGHYSNDLTKEMAKTGGRYGIGHDEEMDSVFSILSKVTKNNVLLIGESGTGKTSIAKGLAERINKGQVPSSLKSMRVIQLDINGLVAAAPRYGNLESLIQTTMDELQKAGNTILFIDEIQEIVGVHGEESEHSLAGILLPYILESKFPIIGTITYADYKKSFFAKESLRQSFQTVEIKEVNPHAAFEIILTGLEELESKYGVTISFPSILAAVELAQRYVYDRKLPDSAVNIIETTSASLEKEKSREMTPQHVADTVTRMTNIPVEEVTTEEATKLLNLEEKIRTKVIGQDEAVHQVVEALKRARTGIRDRNKPIGTFLFLGPTGVGKTHLAKTVGAEYYGDQHKLIRLDMSEFKDVSSISRMLGSTQNSELSQGGITFLDEVKRNPFSVILLDELEKAHPQILDLFLQVLDEGRLTSTNGETINFSNAIIIATSNIGSKTLLDTLEKSDSMFEEAKEKVLQELRNTVRVEFLNRFDKIIVFSAHSHENLEKIAVLLLKELKTRMLDKEISIEWEEKLPYLIAENSYQPGLGARPMRRYIQDKLESALAEKMLRGEISPGDTFTLTADHVSLKPSVEQNG